MNPNPLTGATSVEGTTVVHPVRSYVMACTPRVGSHLLGDALIASRIAGHPREWLPRFTADNAPRTAADRLRMVTQAPAETAYDPAEDAAHIRALMAAGTTGNGVFGVVIHRMMFHDAVRRLQAFTGTAESAPHRVFSAAFPNLSYIWVRRRDRVSQAVSWYKAIQTGVYLGRGKGTGEAEPLRFDYARIRHLLSAVTSAENAWGAFFSSSGVTPLVVYYEDLAAQYVSTVRSVFGFLGLDASGVQIDAPTRQKYADTQSQEWIEQFNQMHNRTRAAR